MFAVYVLFHTHFGAMNFEKKHGLTLENFSLRPTPRKLSSSCGVCAIFNVEDQASLPLLLDEHVAGIYIETQLQNFECLLEN